VLALFQNGFSQLLVGHSGSSLLFGSTHMLHAASRIGLEK
jgi:hypothetical protein